MESRYLETNHGLVCLLNSPTTVCFLVLPAQGPGVWGSKKSELKMSEFGIKDDLLMEKAPVEKMVDLVLKSIRRKYRVQVF